MKSENRGKGAGRTKGEGTAPAHAAPEVAAPGHVAPGHVAPGHVAPGHVAPGHVAPGHVAPGHVAPAHVAPAHAAPEVTASDVTAPELAAGAVDEARLRRHVQKLAGEIGERNVFHPQALGQAADYIAGEWRDQGFQVSRQEYEAMGVVCANLEVTVQGRQRPEEVLLLGAHYDSVKGSPGANDNASGVAALLELSRLFSAQRPALSIRFVAFVNEEPPFFISSKRGSLVYAKAARARGDDIRLMVSLESLGCYSEEPRSQSYPPPFSLFYPDRGNFLAFVSNWRSRGRMRRMARLFRRHSDLPLEHVATFGFIPGVGWSDHLSFWGQGYPAFMVTDTAFYRYACHHSGADRPDRLSYSHFRRAVDGLFRAFADWSGCDGPAARP